MPDFKPSLWAVDTAGTPTHELIGLGPLTWRNSDRELPGGEFTFSLLQKPAHAEELEAGTEFALQIDNEWQTGSHSEVTQVQKKIVDAEGTATEMVCGFQSILRRLQAVPVKFTAPVLPRHMSGTPGAIWITLLNEALADGYLTGWTKDFTSLLDSRGVAWAVTVEFDIEPSWTLWDVLQVLRELRAVDYRMRGHNFRLYNYGTSADDFFTPGAGLKRKTLRTGRDIKAGNRAVDVDSLHNAVVVFGPDERIATAEDATSIAAYGKRAKILRVGAVSNQTDLQAIANSELAAGLDPVGYKTYTVILGAPGAEDPPYVNGSWTIGDRIAVSDDVSAGGQPVNSLVSGIAVVWDALGDVQSIALDVDGRRERRNERYEARVDRIVAGLPGGPPTQRRIAPSPPTDLDLDTELDEPVAGQTLAKILGTYVRASTDTDGGDLLDLAYDEVVFYPTATPQNRRILRVPGTDLPSFSLRHLPTSVGYTVRVTHIDTAGNNSAPESGTITSESDGGTYKGFASDLTTPMFTVDPAGDNVKATKVAGGVLAATGSGTDVDLDIGVRLYDPAGSPAIYLDSTGDASFTGNLYVGGITVIEGDTTIHDDLVVDGTFIVSGTTTLGGILTMAADIDAGGFDIAGGSFTTTSGLVIGGAGLHDLEWGSSSIGESGGALQYEAALHIMIGDLNLAGELDVVGDTFIGGATTMSGAIDHNGSTAGFFGTAPASKPSTITIALGSGGDRNAIRSIATCLATLGLLNNNIS